MYIIVEISEIMSMISFSCCCCGFLHLLDSVPQVDFQFCFPTFQNTKKKINFFFRWFPILFSHISKYQKKNSSQRLLFVVVTLFGNWTKKLQQVKNSCSSNPQDCLSKYWSDLHFPYISYIFNIWISRGKQHCSGGVFLWRDPGWFFCLPLRSSMFSSWSLGSSTISTPSSTPFCTQFFRRAFEEVSQTCLESVGFTRWDFGEIRIESEFRRSSQKLCPGVPRRRRPASIRTRSWSLWSEGLDKNSETVLKRIHGFVLCHIHLTN